MVRDCGASLVPVQGMRRAALQLFVLPSLPWTSFMIPLILDPVVVEDVEAACAQFLKLQRPAISAIQPAEEKREKPVPAQVESAPAFKLS